MAKGQKTGGRTTGTPNKRTADIVARLAALECDPIEGMALLAMDTKNTPELRGRMFAELAGYVAPKRKAVELEHSGSVELDAHDEIDWSGVPSDKLRRLRDAMADALGEAEIG